MNRPTCWAPKSSSMAARASSSRLLKKFGFGRFELWPPARGDVASGFGAAIGYLGSPFNGVEDISPVITQRPAAGVWDSQEAIGCDREGEGGFDFCEASNLHLGNTAHRFGPAEDLLDVFALAPAHGVAGMARGAAIDGHLARLAGDPHITIDGDVRSDLLGSQCPAEAGHVIRLFPSLMRRARSRRWRLNRASPASRSAVPVIHRKYPGRRNRPRSLQSSGSRKALAVAAHAPLARRRRAL